MRLVALLSILATTLVAGCGDSTGPGSVAGTYALVTWDGEPLPVVVWQTWNVDDFVRTELTAGTLRLDRDGTCDFSFAFERTEYTASTGERQVDTETETATGTFSVSESLITFVLDDPDSDSFNGTVSGDRITIDDVVVMVFEK
jgi:hypothetical protein